MNLRQLSFVAAMLTPAAVLADSPLPQPSKYTVCSASSSICAESNPQSATTKVFNRLTGQELWSMPGWHRWMFLSEDGQSLVVGYAGMNLVPVNSDLTLEVLHFYESGRRVRTVKLSDLYQGKAQLRSTLSHLAWVETVKVNRANQLVLALVNGKIVALSMRTGEEVPLSRDGA